MSLQPGASNGNLFGTACDDGILRLFDTRRNSTSGEFVGYLSVIINTNKLIFILNNFYSNVLLDVLQSSKRPGLLFSSMFSPVDSNVIAVAGSRDGTFLFDIRNIKRFLEI